MPQGQIRKGFFFYFGLFVLLLIAIFLVCLVILMFNPGKTMLWMQYFTGDETISVTEDSNSNAKIDITKLTNVEVNCTYAKVTVQNSNEYKTDGIYIINKAKGFATSSQANDFAYTATLNGTVLTLDVEEPNGFIYLSKNIEIILNTYPSSSFNFGNIKLKVTTTDGMVDIGGEGSNGSSTVALGGLEAETGKGDIIIRDFCETATLQTLSLETEEGNISAYKKVSYDGGKSGQGLTTNCDVSFKTTKGLISIDVVNLSNSNLAIDCKKGNVSIDYLYATETNIRCVQGNYIFGKIVGDLSYVNSEDSIISPNIVVDYISGNFRLSTSGNFNAEPDIELKEVGGNINVVADKGSLKVGKLQGTISVTSDGSLSVNLLVASDRNASDAINVTTHTGAIRIGYLGTVSGDTNLTTTSGKITLDFTNEANFTATASKNDGSSELLDDNKISVNIGLSGVQTKNPLTVDGGLSGTKGTIQIATNSSVTYNLVSADKLV